MQCQRKGKQTYEKEKVKQAIEEADRLMIFRAAYLVAGTDTIISDGAMQVEDGHVRVVGAYSELNQKFPQAETIHFPNAVILPGLINAHCHLELSLLKGKLPPGPDFAGWVKQLVELRKHWNKNTFKYSMSKGLDEVIKSGTTTLVDISAQHVYEPLLKSPIRVVECFETYALNAEVAAKQAAIVEDLLRYVEGSDLLQIGISPHAPYTVSPELYRLCFELSEKYQCLLTTHLAETPAESEFLQSLGGPLRQLYDALGYDLSKSTAPGLRPSAYALDQAEKITQPILLAHGNYFDEADFPLLKQKNAAVVYCPRCHEFFGHSEHPFKKLLAAGIPVCLGTDSLASNDSLSLRDEIDFLLRRYPAEDPGLFWKMATEYGAQAMGRGHELGKLQAGYLADFGVYAYAGDTFAYDGIGKLLGSFVGGKEIMASF